MYITELINGMKLNKTSKSPKWTLHNWQKKSCCAHWIYLPIPKLWFLNVQDFFLINHIVLTKIYLRLQKKSRFVVLEFALGSGKLCSKSEITLQAKCFRLIGNVQPSIKLGVTVCQVGVDFLFRCQGAIANMANFVNFNPKRISILFLIILA